MQIGGSVLSSVCSDRCANFVISLTSRLLLSRGLLVIVIPSCLLPINPGHTCDHRTIDASRDGGLRWAGRARPVSGADHHPGGDPQRRPPGPAIGPAAPSAGRAAAPEARAQEVGWGWRGEISRLSFDPLLTRGTLRGLGIPGSRMGLGKDL